MSKPVLVIHPITGQPCYTKHPDRLLKRNAIYLKDGVYHGKEWEEEPTFWNGSDRRSWAMRKPGEVRS